MTTRQLPFSSPGERLREAILASLALALVLIPCGRAGAQEADAAAVLAIADLALERISAEDFVGFTDLMVEEVTLFSVDSTASPTYRARSRTEQRAMSAEVDIVERGFDPEVRVAGPVATVWYPYDIYVAGEWSHCGVDVFNLVQTASGWRIVTMIWTVEQPPACAPHPDGPPPSGEQSRPGR